MIYLNSAEFLSKDLEFFFVILYIYVIFELKFD